MTRRSSISYCIPPAGFQDSLNGRLPQTTMAWVHDSEVTTRRVSPYASSLCSRPHHALGVSPGRPAVEGAVEDPEGPSDALALYPGRRPATTTAIVSRLCRRSCCSQRCSRTRRLRSVLERKTKPKAAARPEWIRPQSEGTSTGPEGSFLPGRAHRHARTSMYAACNAVRSPPLLVPRA